MLLLSGAILALSPTSIFLPPRCRQWSSPSEARVILVSAGPILLSLGSRGAAGGPPWQGCMILGGFWRLGVTNERVTTWVWQ